MLQELQDERELLRAAVQAMQLCRTRAAFGAWVDFVAACQDMRSKLALAVNMFANRSCVQALQTWQVRWSVML